MLLRARLCPWCCAEHTDRLSSLSLTRTLCHKCYEDTWCTDEETEVQSHSGTCPVTWQVAPVPALVTPQDHYSVGRPLCCLGHRTEVRPPLCPDTTQHAGGGGAWPLL